MGDFLLPGDRSPPGRKSPIYGRSDWRERKSMTESQEQRQLIQWCRTDPRLQYMFHIPNETTEGVRWVIRNRQLGVKSGVPDLMLPIPAGPYHGLFIEMKSKTGRASENQKRWIQALTDLGYKAVICKGWIEARDVIVEYLEQLKGGN